MRWNFWRFKKQRFIRITDAYTVVNEWLIVKETDTMYFVKEKPDHRSSFRLGPPFTMWIEKNHNAIVDVDEDSRPVVKKEGNVYTLPPRR